MIHRYVKQILGLLLRKPLSVVEENKKSIARISEEGENVVFISSYPRSGNTWIRHILADCFIQQAGLNTTATSLPIHPDRIIPDRYCNPIAERDTSISTPGLFLKTHDSFETALGLLAPSSYENMRHVYIYRKPEDALVSYFHFHRRYTHLLPETNDGIDAFCLARASDWVENIGSYIKARDAYTDNVFFVSYENMLSNCEGMLMPLFSWLNIPVESFVLQRAISNMSFENLRAREEAKPMNKEEYFFRKGTSGMGAEELQSSTLDEISVRTSAVYRKANAILAEQGAVLAGNSAADRYCQ